MQKISFCGSGTFMRLAIMDQWSSPFQFLLEWASYAFHTLITLALWWALYSARGGGQIAGNTKYQMMGYFIMTGITMTVLLSSGAGDRMIDDISEGKITRWLTMPFSPMIRWAAIDVTRKISTVSIMLVPLIILTIFAQTHILAPFSFVNAFAAIIFWIFGCIIHFFLFSIAGALSFWIGKSWGAVFLLRVLLMLCSGAWIPPELIPGPIGAAIHYLPFRLMAAFPTDVWFGRNQGVMQYDDILLLLLWMIVTIFGALFLFHRGVRQYHAYEEVES